MPEPTPLERACAVLNDIAKNDPRAIYGLLLASGTSYNAAYAEESPDVAYNWTNLGNDRVLALDVLGVVNSVVERPANMFITMKWGEVGSGEDGRRTWEGFEVVDALTFEMVDASGVAPLDEQGV